MKRLLPLVAILAGIAARCLAAESPDWIEKLQSPDIEVRRTAIDRIQTLDDSRIPEACLPLLRDEGFSIRRQAARAIGSRFYQIPKERTAAFVDALKQCAKDAPDGVKFVANRAIGLLTRDFSSDAFSKSPDGRWVLYEQRRLPMIADITLAKRQLLAPVSPDDKWGVNDTYVERGQIIDRGPDGKLLKLMRTNEPMEWVFRHHWQPKGDAIALQPTIQAKFFSPICIWRASDGETRTWWVTSFKSLYGKKFPHWATVIDFVRWDGHKAVLRIYDCDSDPARPEISDPKGILVSVNIDDWKIALEK
jgi:hypothetical protein